MFDAPWNFGAANAVLAPAHYGGIELTLNGVKIDQAPQREHGQISRYHSMYEAPLPDGVLKSAGNLLEIRRTGPMRAMGIPDIYIGPVQKLDALADQYEARLTWVDRATLFILLMGLIVTSILLFVSRKIAHYAFLFATFALLLPLEFRDHITIMSHPLMSFMTYIGLIYLALSALSFSYWTDGSKSERRCIYYAGIFTLIVVALIDVIWGLDSSKTVIARSALFVVCGIALVAWMARSLIKKRDALSPQLIVLFCFCSGLQCRISDCIDNVVWIRQCTRQIIPRLLDKHR